MNKRQENRMREMERTRNEVKAARDEVIRIKASAESDWHTISDYFLALSVYIDAQKAAIAAANPGRAAYGACEAAAFAIAQLDLIRDTLFQ